MKEWAAACKKWRKERGKEVKKDNSNGSRGHRNVITVLR